MIDCVKRFLKVKKSNSVNVTYINARGIQIGAQTKCYDLIIGKELIIDSAFKYFANGQR